MRRLLRPRPSSEIRANSVLDAQELTETEALVDFVGNCRYFAGELALNEMTRRTFSDIQQNLDSGTRALLDALHHAGDADGSFRQSQIERQGVRQRCRQSFGQLEGNDGDDHGVGSRKSMDPHGKPWRRRLDFAHCRHDWA